MTTTEQRTDREVPSAETVSCNLSRYSPASAAVVNRRLAWRLVPSGLARRTRTSYRMSPLGSATFSTPFRNAKARSY